MSTTVCGVISNGVGVCAVPDGVATGVSSKGVGDGAASGIETAIDVAARSLLLLLLLLDAMVGGNDELLLPALDDMVGGKELLLLLWIVGTTACPTDDLRAMDPFGVVAVDDSAWLFTLVVGDWSFGDWSFGDWSWLCAADFLGRAFALGVKRVLPFSRRNNKVFIGGDVIEYISSWPLTDTKRSEWWHVIGEKGREAYRELSHSQHPVFNFRSQGGREQLFFLYPDVSWCLTQ